MDLCVKVTCVFVARLRWRSLIFQRFKLRVSNIRAIFYIKLACSWLNFIDCSSTWRMYIFNPHRISNNFSILLKFLLLIAMLTFGIHVCNLIYLIRKRNAYLLLVLLLFDSSKLLRLFEWQSYWWIGLLYTNHFSCLIFIITTYLATKGIWIILKSMKSSTYVSKWH